MIDRGWNQSEFGRQAGLNRDSISNYVNGHQWPTPASLEGLSRALKMKKEDILPNILMSAMGSEMPAFQVTQATGHPDKVWLQVNRIMSRAAAGKITDIILKEDGV
jgi:transcriptional regulator with XRE-family HTH domain